MQVLHIGDDIVETGSNGITALVGYGTEKYIEIGLFLIKTILEIAVPHGQLVKIAEQGKILRVCLWCHYQNISFKVKLQLHACCLPLAGRTSVRSGTVFFLLYNFSWEVATFFVNFYNFLTEFSLCHLATLWYNLNNHPGENQDTRTCYRENISVLKKEV